MIISIPLAACVLGLHLGTYHVDRNAGYNEFNPGVYANCNGFTAGHYRNSINKDSNYLGYTYTSGRFSITSGVVSGYKNTTMPMIIPSVKVSKHLRILVLPPIPNADTNTAGVHFAWEL